MADWTLSHKSWLWGWRCFLRIAFPALKSSIFKAGALEPPKPSFFKVVMDIENAMVDRWQKLQYLSFVSRDRYIFIFFFLHSSW